MPNESLSEALESATETVAEVPAPAASSEQTESATTESATDNSLQANESVEAKPEETTEAKTDDQVTAQAEPDGIAKIRTWGEGLETDLKALQAKLGEFGGESNLQIMAPMLQKAAEIPLNGDTEKWSGEMWQAVSQSLVPAQVDALRSQAAWDYLIDPASAATIAKDLYGEKMTPELLKEFAVAYERDPTVLELLRPDETPEARAVRERYEADNATQEAKNKQVADQLQKIEDDNHERVYTQTMTQALQVGLAPRAEVKKQFGLEFQKSDQDTPEIAAFKERTSKRYDQIVTLKLGSDPEMNRLSDAAQSWANQKDETRNGQRVDRSAQRQKAVTDFAPMIEQRTRAICSQVAKELKEDLKFLSPELSDQAKANNLRDLKPNVLGGGASVAGASGVDFTNMPDPISNPRGHAAWVSKMFQAQNAEARTPPILQAG